MCSQRKSLRKALGARSITVLLVDDDAELCSSLKRLLGMDGFHVKAVHDADSGVREALEGEYELVILDVMLPGGDGRKVLRRFRLTSQVPVIMLTARGDEADRIAGLERGADDYLPKPFNPRDLWRACAPFCDARAARRCPKSCASAISRLIVPRGEWLEMATT